MDVQALEDIGLTQAQIKVYIALLELGEQSSGPIIKKSRLQSSVVYNAMHQLMELGLITFIQKGQRKYYSAVDPAQLLHLVDSRKEQLEKIIPKLKAKRLDESKQQDAKVYVGWKGIYTAFHSIFDVLPAGSDYIAFSAGFSDQYSAETKQFFKEFQKKRVQKKYRVKLITNASEIDKVQSYPWYKTFGKPEVRLVDGFAPLGVIIFGDNIMHVAFEDKPVAFVITSKQIAESHRKFFYAMWEIAKPA